MNSVIKRSVLIVHYIEIAKQKIKNEGGVLVNANRQVKRLNFISK